MSLYLGIDLGTSNSVIAGLTDGRMRVFRPADGGETLPSIIYFDKRGHRLFGRRAHDQAFVNPENVVAGFKRLMGTKTPLTAPEAGISLAPEECSAAIIGQLLGQMENDIGKHEMTGAVVTIPAAFNQMQSEATLRAARMAGLERVALLQEPVAAAMAAMAGSPRDGYFLIYDLGGGTFDLALAHCKGGDVRVVTHQGINMLGGRDFDRMIVNEVVRPWLAATFDLPENFGRDPDWRRLMRIAALAAERAKIDLSLVEETQVFASEDEVRMEDRAGRDMFIDATLTRGNFEALIREPVANTVALIHSVLKDAELHAGQLESIVFVGGPSRIPLIREMVSAALKVPVDLKLDPMTAVAMGAAWHAEGLTFDEKPGAAPHARRKPVEAHAEVDRKQTGLDLSFDYPARTASDHASLKVVLKNRPGRARWLRALRPADHWQSPLYKLEDGVTLPLPLPQVGLNEYTVAVYDEQRDPLPHGERPIAITRTAVRAASIPAAQSIAVKVLDRRAGGNALDVIIEKGTPLPAEGKAVFQAARDLAAGDPHSLSLELFQLEYPERVELNLCVGVFYIGGNDLPEDYVLRKGEPVTFNWAMDESGILGATVLIPSHEEEPEHIELATPRFYSPQAAALAYDIAHGLPFTHAMLAQAENDWGDLVAAIGPGAGADVQLLKDRLDDQTDILRDNPEDSEIIRQVSEEARFLRQDIARAGRRYLGPLLERRLGRLSAIFNRVARNFASAEEMERFEQGLRQVREILDRDDAQELPQADPLLEDLTGDFFDIAWRDRGFVRMWFNRLKDESHLFPDQDEFASMVAAGAAHDRDRDDEALRLLVKRMFDARVRLSASDAVADPATLMR